MEISVHVTELILPNCPGQVSLETILCNTLTEQENCPFCQEVIGGYKDIGIAA
jgi:hypothetical protein